MIVEIIDAHQNQVYPNIGETYYATPYRYDSDKITLHYMVDAKTGQPLSVQHCDNPPLCNEYIHSVKVIDR